MEKKQTTRRFVKIKPEHSHLVPAINTVLHFYFHTESTHVCASRWPRADLVKEVQSAALRLSPASEAMLYERCEERSWSLKECVHDALAWAIEGGRSFNADSDRFIEDQNRAYFGKGK